MTFDRGNQHSSVSTNFVAGLHDDVLFLILSYCDLQSLGRLSQVCQRLRRLIQYDSVWKHARSSLSLVSSSRKKCRKLSPRDECRLAINWNTGRFQDNRIVHHGIKQMPWLQLDDDHLWISYQNKINCYNVKNNGHVYKVAQKKLSGHALDVSKFVCRSGTLISVSQEGSICCFNTHTGHLMNRLQNCHTSDIHSVDFQNDIVITGSRDASVKVWSIDSTDNGALRHSVSAIDRVWSVALSPNMQCFASGTAGINHIAPLRLWDTYSGQLIRVLGSDYKYGAGVLDIQFEDQNIMFSCGYDTYIRMWDIRTQHNQCVRQWEEPFDSTIYCLKSDHNNMFVAGTARHGMVRLWDKRATQPVQLYYAGKTSSPVYSLALDTKFMYVALDKGINMLNFDLR